MNRCGLWWTDPSWPTCVHPVALSLPPSAGQRDKNTKRKLIDQDKDRRDHSPITVMGKKQTQLEEFDSLPVSKRVG